MKDARALLSYRENMPRIIDTLHHRGYRVLLVPNRPADNFNEVGTYREKS